MDDSACPECRILRARLAQLEAQLAELTRRLDEVLRAGKRQADPLRKGKRAASRAASPFLADRG